MDIEQLEFYHLLAIEELTKSSINQKVQVIGKVEQFTSNTNRIVFTDASGSYTLFYELKDLSLGDVIRVYGTWDGIQLKPDKLLHWEIDSKNIPRLFKTAI